MNRVKDIKRLEAVFERESGRFDRTTMFERFLEFVIAGFDISGRKLDRPFNKGEARISMSLLQEWLSIMQERTRNGGWYDILGELYMNSIASNGKKSCTGQFFTPMHICDFMVNITEPGEYSREAVMDSCCGSGRMLLASHSCHSGCYCCGQDLDRLCCLMAVCNFLVHGINGEVVWGNSLNPLDYREGWRINETLGYTGIPTVTPMVNHDSRIYRSGIMSMEVKQNADEKVAPQTKSSIRSNECVQLSLFE